MADIFKENPALESYFKTADGEAFYTMNDAKNHAKKLEDKTVETVVRGAQAAEGGKSEAKQAPKAADVIALIEAAQTAEELEQYKGDTRKTVADALAKRLDELNPAE